MIPVDNIAQLIGDTPMVRIQFPEIPPHITLYGKLEGHNPGGSVKDRPAYQMISQALKRGDITPETRLVEATSGNTGIALAMVAAAFKLDITLIMPENSTQERIDTMRAFGARVILTEAAKTIEYSRTLADEMVANEGYYMLNQFANPDNYWAHYHSTGPEIWRDTQGQITHFVASMGTTGTIMGNSRYLKEQNPAVRIVGVQPEEGASIPGIRKWSPEFLPQIFEPERIDQILYVNEAQATQTTRRMAREAGIFAGMSSGGVMHAALELAQSLTEPALMVCIVCDRGDRYLSSPLFAQTP
ncbi:cysteine synthase CysM [Eisenibacter elegans]|uniref:cysteine synthase CysM n=1 Tax=Eisenibacter elegans TaxID=997 RepID=UPI00041C1AB4|nr:cysteine synthase CysM [Eisenibacter elegans]